MKNIKIITILLSVLFIGNFSVYCGEINPETPRAGKFAGTPGHYELLIRNLNPVIDPGEYLTIEGYITGYGLIHASKLAIITSSEIFDKDLSKLSTGVKKENKKIVFGGDETLFDSFGKVIDFSGGLQSEKWEKQTMFFDLSERGETPIISTETKQITAPIYLKLKIKDEAKPGIYTIHFGFTYFNSTEWKSSRQDVEFAVRNILQRNEKTAWCVALIAATIAIISGVSPILKFFYRKYMKK